MHRTARTAEQALNLIGWGPQPIEPGGIDSPWAARQRALHSIGWKACTHCREVQPIESFERRRYPDSRVNPVCWRCRMSRALRRRDERIAELEAQLAEAQR